MQHAHVDHFPILAANFGPPGSIFAFFMTVQSGVIHIYVYGVTLDTLRKVVHMQTAQTSVVLERTFVEPHICYNFFAAHFLVPITKGVYYYGNPTDINDG